VNNALHADVDQASAVIDGRHEINRSTSQSEFQFWSDFTQLFIAQERPQQMTVSGTRYCPAPLRPFFDSEDSGKSTSEIHFRGSFATLYLAIEH